jgi:hypothetical protein
MGSQKYTISRSLKSRGAEGAEKNGQVREPVSDLCYFEDMICMLKLVHDIVE